MKWEEWRFSAHLAWQDRFIRWGTIAISAVILLGSGLFVYRLLPEGVRSGFLTTHYTIYLGIDEVRPWQWIFLYPSAMVGISAMNNLVIFGIYRRDILAAKALLAFTCALTLLWGIYIFFLALINV